MTWTILVLVVAIALYMFGGMLIAQDSKKPSAKSILAKKAKKQSEFINYLSFAILWLGFASLDLIR